MNEIGGNGPMGAPEMERPELHVKAVAGIFNTDEDPPKGPKTATANYAVTTRRMKKSCKKH